MLFLQNDACLAEKQQIQFFKTSIWFDPSGAQTHSTTLDVMGHANHYTTDAFFRRLKFASGSCFCVNAI